MISLAQRAKDAAVYAIAALISIVLGGIALGGWTGDGLEIATLTLFAVCGCMAAGVSWMIAKGRQSWLRAIIAGLLTSFLAAALVALVLGGGMPFLVPLSLLTAGLAFAIPAAIGSLLYRWVLIHMS
jgi:hypothetical protein